MSEELVSVIIPMYNAASYVGRCLDSVLNQDYPPDKVEILVVDGASTDSSAAIVRNFMREHPRIRLLPNPMRRVCHAFNVGIRDSKGDVIIFVGCRGVLDRTFVTKCIENLRNVREAAAVGGVTRMGYENFMEKAIGLALSCPFGVSTARYRYAAEAHFTDTAGKSSTGVNFGAYRREVLEEVGGADEDMIFADDDELNWRILKAGHRMFMDPEIKYFYYPRDSMRALSRQYFGYGRGRAMALKKHPDRLGLKHLIPSAFVVFLLFGFVLSLLIPYVWIAYVWILGLYALFSLVFSAKIAFREGWRLFPILPVLFFILHVSYGLGFLRELIGGHRPPTPVEAKEGQQ